jgi:hypothetical protein
LTDNAPKIASLPVGQAARHPLWPRARWNLSGLFAHGRAILDVFLILKERFGCHLDIDSAHGAPGVLWNCGRLSQTPVPPVRAVEGMIQAFNAAGIGVFYTFTNHLLVAEDLEDPTCNGLLEMIDNGKGLNGVILASDLLFDRIRKRHPELSLTASIVKVSMEEGRGKPEYYHALGERFDSVMLHPDDGYNPNLLDKLDRDKLEILVNENCAMGCPGRNEDYELMAMLQKGPPITDYSKTPLAQHENLRCRMPLRKLNPDNRSCNFTVEEMKQVYDLGFYRFKLQGRRDNLSIFLYDLLRFATEPELVMPIVFKSFASGLSRQYVGEVFDKLQRGEISIESPAPAEPKADEKTDEPSLLVVPTPQTHGKLPSGEMATHPFWPEARWNISGLITQGRYIFDVYTIFKERFGHRMKIDSVHGAPGVPWNSGRLSQTPVPSFDGLATAIKQFNDEGIGVFYTFSNHLLEAGDMADPTCNRMLDVVDNGTGLNGVILASELLYDHVKQTHPALKLTASIIKVTMEEGLGHVDYYRSMTDRFDSVMIHPDDGLNFDLLDQLDREKMEILVNENCILHCQTRQEHYRRMARQQRTPDRSTNEKERMDANLKPGCLMPMETLAGRGRSCNFTTREMKHVYDMGFRRFKLQGRDDSPSFFLYDLLRYTIEPELLMPVIYKAFVAGAGRDQADTILKEALLAAEDPSAT